MQTQANTTQAKKAPAVPKADKPAAKSSKPKAVAAKPEVKLSMPITASAADIDKAIASIKLRGAKLDKDIHSAACASLNHSAKHNDPTLLCRLVNAMPKSARRNSLVVWALKHGNVMQNDDAKTRELLPLVYAKGKTADIDAAIAEPFWEMKRVAEGGTQWVFTDYISNVMKKLETVAADAAHPDHARAKAAYDALHGVTEALAVPPAAVVH